MNQVNKRLESLTHTLTNWVREEITFFDTFHRVYKKSCWFLQSRYGRTGQEFYLEYGVGDRLGLCEASVWKDGVRSMDEEGISKESVLIPVIHRQKKRLQMSLDSGFRVGCLDEFVNQGNYSRSEFYWRSNRALRSS